MAALIYMKERLALTILISSSLLIWISYRIYKSIVLKLKRHEIARQNGCLPVPKFPQRDPILGTDLLFRAIRALKEDRMLQDMDQRFDEASPGGLNTYWCVIMGRGAIMTREPENMKTILSTNFKDFELPYLRKEVVSRGFGQGIFSSDGPAWEHARAMLRPNFNRAQVNDLVQLEPHVLNLIRRIPKDGSTVDLQDLFPQLTLDSASELLVGESTYSLVSSTNDDMKRFGDAFDYVIAGMARTMRLGPLATFQAKDQKLQDSYDFVNAFMNQFVEKAIRYRNANPDGKDNGDVELETGGDKRRYVFLHELAKSNYSAAKIRTELLSILIAGRDTTAALLSLLWYKLARRPDVVAKLRKEMEHLGDEPPTLEQMKNLKYLKWTINEVLRVLPVAPVNSRTAANDTILPLGGGPDGKSPVFLKAGTRVVFSTYSMQRRKDLFGEDAAEFRPERWENLKPGWEYIPFSGGPRICIGQQLALTETTYTTVRLLQAFKGIQVRDDQPFSEKLSITLASKHGCKVALTPA